MLLILRSAAWKLRSANTLLRVGAVSNGDNKEESGDWRREGFGIYDCNSRGEAEGQNVCYLLLRPWSLCGLVCVYLDTESLAGTSGSLGLDLWRGAYEQTKLTEQGRQRG